MKHWICDQDIRENYRWCEHDINSSRIPIACYLSYLMYLQLALCKQSLLLQPLYQMNCKPPHIISVEYETRTIFQISPVERNLNFSRWDYFMVLYLRRLGVSFVSISTFAIPVAWDEGFSLKHHFSFKAYNFPKFQVTNASESTFFFHSNYFHSFPCQSSLLFMPTLSFFLSVVY